MRLDAAPDLGAVGVWTWPLVTAPADHVRTAAAAIEDMGYGALWFPESSGREAIALSAMLLGATSTIHVAPGIANIWARDAHAAAGAALALGEAWPGRFTLGLGVSHAPSVARRGWEYHRPLTRMREYLDAMAETNLTGPPPPEPVPVVLAALGPRMLELAAARTGGAHPYFVPVAHTKAARDMMGPDAYLAPEQAVVLEADPERARALARSHTERYLRLDNYRNNLLRLGWSEESLRDGGSDELVDAIVAWGSPDQVAQRVRAHHLAGADHVSIQVLSQDSSRVPVAELETLAPLLL